MTIIRLLQFPRGGSSSRSLRTTTGGVPIALQLGVDVHELVIKIVVILDATHKFDLWVLYALVTTITTQIRRTISRGLS